MKIKIGLAWRADTDKNSYLNFYTTVKEIGGEPVLLGQVIDYDLKYVDGKIADEGVDKNDYLSPEYAEIVKKNTYRNSNIKEAIKEVEAIIFTGGEDISPTLTKVPEKWHGNEYEKNYNPTRDVSDYLLMSYCIDNDIKVLGVCRGMQMLAVVSGAEMIQDIPMFYEEKGLEYNFEHRNHQQPDGGYRDFASHGVRINDKNSVLYSVYRQENLEKMPSWHHQAVRDVSGTPLKVTALSISDVYELIEAVERTDKTLIVGIQFHPEAAVLKNIKKAGNAGEYADKETALKIFNYFLEKSL